MAATYDDQPPPAASRKNDNFSDVFNAVWLEVEFGKGMVGLRPSVMPVVRSKGYGSVNLR